MLRDRLKGTFRPFGSFCWLAGLNSLEKQATELRHFNVENFYYLLPIEELTVG